MTVVVKDIRKVVVLGWDTDVVKGKTASIQADGKELRVVPNKGKANVFYPLDYTGTTSFTVQGSKGGTDTGTVKITGEEQSTGDNTDDGGDEEMANTAEYVFYNDGEDENVYALVTKDNGDDSLNLYLIPASGQPSTVNAVPRREPEDYDAAGGGHTWHEDETDSGR
jgi:hypothetical protein